MAWALFLILFLGIPQPSCSAADEKQLLIGLSPEMNIFKQKQRYMLLGDYLSKKTGVRVRFTILSKYGNLIDSFNKEKLDAAFFGSFTGAVAIRKHGVVPLVRPVTPDNNSAYKGYVFVRNDSGITNIKGLKGRTFAFVEKATTAGYVFPLALLRENGISSPEGYFRSFYFAGSHDAAIDAVLRKKADAGAAKNTIYDMMSANNPSLEKELRIIARSPAVPSNGLCVRKGLDESLKKKLRETLLAMHNDPNGKTVLSQFGALKFIETTEKDYDPVHDLARKAGIDLMKYSGKMNE